MSPCASHRLQLRVERSADTVRIIVEGDLDRSTVHELRSSGNESIAQTGLVCVDLVSASVIDSAALGVLIELHRNAADHGTMFEVAIRSGFQRSIFHTTGLSDYFDLREAPSADDAVR